MSEERTLEKGVQHIYEVGEGAEASVSLELRRVFPGIGSTISIEQDLETAYRLEKSPGQGHRRFLLHTIIKKLEDYFFRTEKYGYAHITRPLGSTLNGCLYEWAPGMEGFPWEYQDSAGKEPVSLEEWNAFVMVYDRAGIDMLSDITDCDDGRISKNIIHKTYRGCLSPDLNRLWKRIDFGGQSLRVDYEKLENYLETEWEPLVHVIGFERYHMLTLANKYLIDPQQLKDKDKKLLGILVNNYRFSTLRHLNARGFEPNGNSKLIQSEASGL